MVTKANAAAARGTATVPPLKALATPTYFEGTAESTVSVAKVATDSKAPQAPCTARCRYEPQDYYPACARVRVGTTAPQVPQRAPSKTAVARPMAGTAVAVLRPASAIAPYCPATQVRHSTKLTGANNPCIGCAFDKDQSKVRTLTAANTLTQA